MPLNHLEICSHVYDSPIDSRTCGTYSCLARFQYGSLVRFTPPDMMVTLRLFTDEETAKYLFQLREHAETIPNVRVQIDILDHAHLFRRAIGRNIAALGTTADWLWHTDVDYIFGVDCLQSLREAVEAGGDGERFVTPKIVKLSKSNQEGYQSIIDQWTVLLPEINDEDFSPRRQGPTIGGVQIASRALCHRIGYLDRTKWVKPLADTSKGMREFRDDKAYRRSIGCAEPLDVVNLYRIRHCYEKGIGGPAVESGKPTPENRRSADQWEPTKITVKIESVLDEETGDIRLTNVLAGGKSETDNGTYSPRKSRRSGYFKTDQGMCDALTAVLEPGCSVLDLGAGRGHYVKWLSENGHPEASGIDGTEGIYQLSEGLVFQADLTKEEKDHVELSAAFGMDMHTAICLEVGEHIPKQHESVFLDNIANAASTMLFISWALPQQQGKDHVNCRTTEWVTSEIVKRGWELDEKLTLKARVASGQHGGGRGNMGWRGKLLVLKRQQK